ncbi:hypothetical protein [Shigella sp. FC1967]|nr:hypothetical protein [Shigella sp. FC1967]
MRYINAVAYTKDDIELEASDILHVGLEEFIASKTAYSSAI